MNVGGETIQLSFGPAANAVAAHLVNLQGLAGTSSFNDMDTEEPLCDPYITHAVYKDTYVPRVLFVDGRNYFSPWPDQMSHGGEGGSNSNNVSDAWTGQIEVHYRTSTHQSHKETNEHESNLQSYNSNNSEHFRETNETLFRRLSSTQQDAFSQFQNAASILSSPSNEFSRYRAANYKKVSSQFVYTQRNDNLSSNDGRTMIWDDDEQEEDGSEEDDDDLNERKERLKRQRWNQQQGKLSDEMHNAWDIFTGDHQEQNMTDIDQQKDSSLGDVEEDLKNPFRALSWMHYFMPPHPSMNMFASQLPFDYTSSAHNYDKPFLYSYNYGYGSSGEFCSTEGLTGINNSWKEHELLDKLRKWMEDCDSLRGVNVLIDSEKAFFAGLATTALEEIKDECKSAAKFSVLIHDGEELNAKMGSRNEADDTKVWRSERSVVRSFRNGMSGGLSLHGIAEHSDLLLPISLQKSWISLHEKRRAPSLFEASAMAALSLESISLPYRLSRSAGGRTKIGINSGIFQGSGGSDTDAFPTAQRLSYHELIASMKPSNRHIFTELCTSHMSNPVNLHSKLLEGTSIERRQLEQEREMHRNSKYRLGRQRDIDPGSWLEDEGMSGGIMTSLLPSLGQSSDRSTHDHFALSATLRCLPSGVGNVTDTYTTSLMEGMGIRYRPQTSISTVVAQPLDVLTGYGVDPSGLYWRSIFGPSIKTTQELTILSNSTRVHSHLNHISDSFKSALSRKYSGYLQRDVVSGLAPDSEDCTDALETCMAYRDVYEPRMNFSDDEGGYFSDNIE
jgi:hypothetical protein